MLDEDQYILDEWQSEMGGSIEDWNQSMNEEWFDEEDWDIIEEDEDFGPPVVGSPRPRVDMTTRDRMHGGRHLKCRWGKYGGGDSGEHHEGRNGEGHHGWKRHHGRKHFMHAAKRGIFFWALSFVVMMLLFCSCNRRSLWHRRRYERLSDIHNSVVERNLNQVERDEVYRKVMNSNWCQQEALRK